VETTTGAPMSAESADALHLGVGVAATCVGAVCSLYTCCRHVWRRLKGYTPAVGAGAAVAAAAVAAGQLASSSAGSAPLPRGASSEEPAARCPGQDAERCCRVDMVCKTLTFYGSFTVSTILLVNGYLNEISMWIFNYYMIQLMRIHCF
jgi:hypothetical protein